MPRLEKRRVGLSAVSPFPDDYRGAGMPLLSLTRASRSKQGTKIAEKGFLGKEIQNTKTDSEKPGGGWSIFKDNFDENREGIIR